MRSAVRTAALCVVIAGTALALYARAGSAWFFEDDLQWLAGTLTFQPSSLLDVSSQVHFYRPIVALYFWAATPLFGGSPALFHWANNLLHAVNAVMVFVVAGAIGYRWGFAFAAAMFFVTMPAYVEAIAWVSALAESVTTLFALLCVYAWLRSRHVRSTPWRVISLGAFVLALMAHESGVVLLPLLLICERAFANVEAKRSFHAGLVRARYFAPEVLILTAYLLVDAAINSRSYLVEEGHYRLGFHAVRNLLAYVISLYLGKHNLASFVAVALVLLLLLVRGTPRVVFATAWLVLWILPFAFFTWGNASRYAYTPAIGLAWLLTEALVWLDQRFAQLTGARVRLALTTVIAAFITVRFGSFTAKAVENFSKRTEPYRQVAANVQRASISVLPGAQVVVDGSITTNMQYRYVEALVRWSLQDPTLTVVISPPPTPVK
ncbi:hypothetical protein BH18ACI5_BH18ACI5_02340 [soil metagenome]